MKLALKPIRTVLVWLPFLATLAVAAHSAPKKAEFNSSKRNFKPGADIFIVSPQKYQFDENKTVLLDLELDTSAVEGQLRVELKPDAGIQLRGSAREWLYENTGKSIHLPLQIGTGSAGRYFIHIFATEQKADGRELARALAVIVQVGEELIQLPKPTPKIISLPAQETIR